MTIVRHAFGSAALVGFLLPLSLAGAGASGAPRSAGGQHEAEDLGTVDFAVSCSPRAQQEFNRAVALLHHMTYPGARQAFERVAVIDPACAMAHWGVAMTLFQPLWPTRPGPEDLARGWAAVERARAVGLRTERERLFVDAAAAFYSGPQSDDYWARIRGWERAMARAYQRLPDDPELAAFYALAHLAAAPAGPVSIEHASRAAEILLRVYRRNPAHPGAMHYLVHANDAPGRERESLDVTRRYEAVAPRNPHALHMPTHIYTRLGNWDAVIGGNLRAAEAALEHPAGDRGQFVWDEFPHAIEYLVYAHLQKGADGLAASQLNRLRGTGGLQPTFKTAFHLASTAARFALERHAWRDAMALAPREPASLDWDRFWWPEAVTWFARGLGAVHEQDVAAARQAAGRLRSLEAAADGAGEELFARNIRVLRLEVDGWIAQAERSPAVALERLREAAALEESTPKHAVTPAPTLPARELLGDLLLAQRRPAEALRAYERALELYPGRFNSLLGAARAAHAAGDLPRARARYAELLRMTVEGSRRSAVERELAAVNERSPGIGEAG